VRIERVRRIAHCESSCAMPANHAHFGGLVISEFREAAERGEELACLRAETFDTTRPRVESVRLEQGYVARAHVPEESQQRHLAAATVAKKARPS